MASISPVSAIDLDILLNIQQAMMIPSTSVKYRSGVNHKARLIDSETKKNIHADKQEILYF